MTIRLRPHHLLCLLTYAGKGYTPAFVKTYDGLVERLNAGEDIALIDGPDDICAPMLGEPDCHCRDQSVSDRDRRAARDVGNLIGTGTLEPGPLEPGSLTVSADRIERLRAAFRKGTIRSACSGCEWQDFCTTIAKNGFRDSRFRPPPRK